jgi:putative aldouronate transport system substrate-binding protein
MSGKLSLSRRQFIQATAVGAGMLMMPRFLTRAQGSGPDFDATIWPGSPNVPGGWTTQLPPVPEGLPLNPAVSISANRAVGLPFRILNDYTSENNPFTRMIKELMGIEWKVKWEAVGEEGETKFQLALASRDLPDVFDWVGPRQLTQLLEADLLEDITDVWEANAGPLLRGALDANPFAWDYVRQNGRLYGVPVIENSAQNDMVMWIRQDWLDKVGMSVPTTVEEFEAVAQAFVDARLGGDGTMGVAASSYLNTWINSLDPIIAGFGVLNSPHEGSVTAVWREDASGNLAFDSLRPEMKDVLALLRRWYETGILGQDFFTLDPAMAVETVIGNKAGISFSPSWFDRWGVSGSMGNDPEARWIVADIPAGPAGQHKTWSNPFREASFAFRKGFPYVAEVIKYWNWCAHLYQELDRRMHGWEGINYTLEDGVYRPIPNEDLPDMNPWWHYFFTFVGTDPLKEFKKNEQILEWATLPEDSLDAMQKYTVEQLNTGLTKLDIEAYNLAVSKTDEQGIRNEFNALATPTMVTHGVELAGLENQTLLGIVTGQKSLDEFDTFVGQWKQLGGDDITREVNEWWQSRTE